MEDVQALHKAVYDRFGECGFLLNNAGTGVGAPSAYRDLDGWRTNLETNLFGILHVLQLFVPSMLAQETPCTTALSTATPLERGGQRFDTASEQCRVPSCLSLTTKRRRT